MRTHPIPEGDPRQRQCQIELRLNATAVRAVDTDFLTIRVDLEPD